jgi:hypothetical protein
MENTRKRSTPNGNNRLLGYKRCNAGGRQRTYLKKAALRRQSDRLCHETTSTIRNVRGKRGEE